MKNIKIRYNNEEYTYESGTSLLDISKDFKDNYKNDIITATVDKRLTFLDSKINKDCDINFYDITSPLGRKTYIRGLYFLFVKAVKDVLNCDVKIMYYANKGVFCEILTNNPISEVTTEKIKIEMRKLKEQSIPISKITVSRFDAMDYFNKINEQDKSETLKYISNSTISLYKLDDSLDYFYGVLPCNTKHITDFNLKYVESNRIMLLPPIMYDKEEKIKYAKNDKIISVFNEQIKYLQNININSVSDLNKEITSGRYGELIRTSEMVQNNKLLELADKIIKNKDVKLVLLGGPYYSGKSITAKKLSAYIKSKGYDSILLSLDDFYVDMKDRMIDEDGNIELEKIEAFDTKTFNTKISDLISGKEVVLPKYNYELGKKEFNDDKKVRMREKSIIIIEGVHAFNEKFTEMIPNKNKYKIYVSSLTPLNIDNHNLFNETDSRLLRMIIKERKNLFDMDKMFNKWKNLRKIEEDMVFSHINDADEIFNTSLVYELAILKTYAESILYSFSKDSNYYDETLRLINIFKVILSMPSEDVPDDSVIREFIGRSCFKNL